MSALFIPISSCFNVTPEHTRAIDSHCWTGSEGGHHHVFCEVRNLLHIFEDFDDPGAHVY